MKNIYQLRNKVALLLSGVTSVLLMSCVSYQAATYDDDGIYSSESPVVVSKDVAVKNIPSNTKYYEDYFGRTVTDYGEIVENEVFTDVDSYSSQDVSEQDAEPTVESYAAWEDANDNVTINVYNSNPYNSFYRPYNYWNNYYYNDWAFCGPSWGWGGYYNNFGYYGYNYGYPYYYNSPYNYGYYGRRNYGYINGPRNRRYASNNYYGRHSNRRGSLRSSRTTPNRSPRATVPRATPRPRGNTPRTTPRATPRPRGNTPRTTPRATPRPRGNTTRTTPRATPRPRGNTPRVTPRSVPRSTPRSRAVTPRSTPRSNSRGSSSSRRGRA